MITVNYRFWRSHWTIKDNNYNKALTLSPGIKPDGNRVTGGAMENTGGTSCTSFTIMTISMPAMFLLSWPGSA